MVIIASQRTAYVRARKTLAVTIVRSVPMVTMECPIAIRANVMLSARCKMFATLRADNVCARVISIANNVIAARMATTTTQIAYVSCFIFR